jgi:Tol biopolymer transport system component
VPETRSLPATINDRYVIERELGGGAATSVYLARDRRQDRLVAVKVLRPALAAGGGAERFLGQIPTIARLQHANLLPIVDWGRDRQRSTRGAAGEDLVFCVSPYVETGSLRQRLERERQLPLDDAMRIVDGIASALDVAHGYQLVHGAIKPENILLREGDPLLDFAVGLSLAGPAREWEPNAEIMTRAAAYMSPEQLAGQPVDGRTDQYSLAAVFYEMLAGEPAFVGATLEAVTTHVMAAPPRRLTAMRVVPRVVERAVHRALAKTPGERFRTAGEFRAALHVAPASGAARVPRRRPRLRVGVVAAILVVLAGVGAAVASRAVAARRSPAPAHRQLTFTGTATDPALSPDGRSVAYVAGGRSLVVQPLAGGRPTTLVPSAFRVRSPRWTHDGRSLLAGITPDSSEREATYVVPVAGGVARRLFDHTQPFDVAPNSTQLVRASRAGGRLEIVSIATGRPERAIAIPDSLGDIVEVAWSPDGRWIGTAGADGRLWTVAANGRSATRVADGVRRMRWSPASDAIYFLAGPSRATDLMRVGIDGPSGRPTGGATRVTSLIAADGFDIARNNRLVHTQANPGPQAQEFFLGDAVPRQVVDERALAEPSAVVRDAAVSPDGEWVAYTSARAGVVDIHVTPFGGGPLRVAADSPAREEAPSWSPDGLRLTYASEDSAGRVVMIADSRTTVPRRVGSLPGPGVSSVAADGPQAIPARALWSASGRHVAYYAQDLRRIVLVNLQRRTESVIDLPDSVGTGHGFVVPSPNGTQLVAATRVRPDEPATLWQIFANGTRWRRIRGPLGESLPIAWHRNGWVYLVRNRGLATARGSVHVELWRLRGPVSRADVFGRPELYAPLPEGCGLAVSISADATQGVCSYTRVDSDLYVASNFGSSGR